MIHNTCSLPRLFMVCRVLLLSVFSWSILGESFRNLISLSSTYFPHKNLQNDGRWISITRRLYLKEFKENSTTQFIETLPENQRLESLDKLATLPPPGGTPLKSGIVEVLKRAHSVFQLIPKDFTLASLSFYIVANMDYDSVVGRNHSTFQRSVSEYLHVFFWGEYAVQDVNVTKGSVKISFNVTKNGRSSGKPFDSPGRSAKLVKRNVPSSDSQNSRTSSEPLEEEERTVTHRDTRIVVRFRLDADYPEVARGKQEDFKKHLLRQLARDMRVPVSSIKEFNVTPGTTVSFVLAVTNDENNVMDEKTVIEAADDLKYRVRNKRLRLHDLEGKPLLPEGQPLTSSQDDSKSISYAILGLLVAVLLMIAVFVLLIGLLAKKQTVGSKRQRLPKSRSKAYRDTAIQETGRESTLSMSGRYSYDSGLWLGPGPEPSFIVPEAPFYRPPTADQLASTPRPATAVRSRLKRSWNIDPDQTLPPIPDGGENWDESNAALSNQRSASEPTYTVN